MVVRDPLGDGTERVLGDEPKVTPIGKNKPHFGAFMLCRMCGHAWMAALNTHMNILELPCSACGECRSFPSYIPAKFLKEFL